ncbi:RagB/SusD family nutrient uptake outer membrane protein [Chryseolinea lacunae]|uniref:RagB/SusD family nutrient uptake outer membrane protein n=1 Tax=Chryseolinea lacunae TaxID=2801331 RepID=A0ABS1KM35_9BACT|nr:RagB/SusD family nutrient uptake outer membrane protein [Chryseolinea lacunae]MBL0740515.1 RagB/SusD family nutrient uptake outer membrane protein [Chryseolinea lacunae]
MKKKIVNLITAGVAMLFMVTSCVSDLDPESLGPNSVTSADAYKTPADYKMGLAKLYSSYVVAGQVGPGEASDISNLDVGFGVYLRAYWNLQELPTDEAVYTWAEDGGIRPLHWQTWTATNSFISAMYTRMMLTISYCNEFIRASQGSTDADVKKFHAEARFLRALSYYHALDLFGYPPFVTETDIPGAFSPKQTNPEELFAYIDSELTAIENELGEPRFEYGRADKGALWMLQAKLYLNAETYIKSPRYTECITALNKVFTSGKYALAANYLLNFRADNNTSPEIIFPINHDAKNTQTYGGMSFIVHGQIGGSMVPADFGVNGGWAQNRVTPEFVAKFADPSGATDVRAQFYTSGQQLEINDVGTFTDGYAVTKFKNKTLAGGPAPSGGNPDFVDIDFPMFRLADAYLMYAEAVLRGGTGGTATQALDFVNALRTRAYGNASGNITSGQLNTAFVLDERARELLWECHRRTDLIRYGLLTGGTYLWNWKGNTKAGTATEAFRNLFPIPASDLAANTNLRQVVIGY